MFLLIRFEPVIFAILNEKSLSTCQNVLPVHVCRFQLCMCSAASIAHNNKQNVVYVDANGGFCAQRIAEFLSVRHKLDKVLSMFISRGSRI